MKKRILSFIVIFVIMALSLSSFCFAESDYKRFIDEAGVTTPDEYQKLQDLLDKTSEKLKFDIAIVVISGYYDDPATIYDADDIYDEFGYGYGENYDGLLLLVDINNDIRHVSTCGKGIELFSDEDIQEIGSQIVGDIRSGNYYTAFSDFVNLCSNHIDPPFDVFMSLIIALVIAVIVAFIVTAVLKGQLKSVRYRAAAADYQKAGSLNITGAGEYFLYHNVTKRKKPEKSSGGGSVRTSSSGRSHGGGSF